MSRRLWSSRSSPLSKDFHTKQSSLSPNVVHGWLQALAACEPAPKLPAALLKYLTKTFNAWHLTVPMLEAHTLHLPAEAQAFDTLLELHETLNDRDAVCAVWARRAVHAESRTAVALEQYGAWSAAQAAYTSMMGRWQQGEAALVNTPKAELQMWEDGVLRAAKKLNQWELLTEFAKQTQQPQLLMECSWKSSDWEKLKELFSKYSRPSCRR